MDFLGKDQRKVKKDEEEDKKEIKGMFKKTFTSEDDLHLIYTLF